MFKYLLNYWENDDEYSVALNIRFVYVIKKPAKERK